MTDSVNRANLYISQFLVRFATFVVTHRFLRMAMQASAPPTEWAQGLFSCCSDFSTFCYAWCFGPCAISSLRTEFDSSSCCFNFLCVSPALVRNIIRESYGIEGGCCGDIWIMLFCLACAAVQMKNEMKQPYRVKPQKPPGSQGREWSNGLVSCEMGGPCILAWLCPKIALAQARTGYDESNCLFNCVCVQPCVVRNIVREGYGIEGGCCGDMMVTCFLPCCVSHQIQREVVKCGSIRQYRNALVVNVATPQPMIAVGQVVPSHQQMKAAPPPAGGKQAAGLELDL